MSQQQMNCKEERNFGVKLAVEAEFAKTKSCFEDSNCDAETILKTALAESTGKGGIDLIVSKVLEGPSWWSYIVLRYLPDVCENRDKLLQRATENPKSAYYTLSFVSDLGGYRNQLIQAVLGDQGWMSLASSNIPDFKDVLKTLALADDTPPVENGWGYNTYFVNESGADFWVSYNTGEMMSDGSITGPILIKKGQNVGFGRGGACIVEARFYTSKPSSWGSQSWQNWSLPQGSNACKSWGFRLNQTGLVETEEWYSGGMPDKYPPSNGE